MTYSLDDPIVAIATSHSNQALSIIRCSGKNSIALVASVFSSSDRLINAKGNTTHVGYIVEENKKIDQVVVCIYREPKSFTGEDSVEIIAHGSSYTTLSIYNLLIKKGFRVAERGEFSFRAFSNGKINLTQAEGIRLLSSAKTQLEAQLAISQVENKLFTLITDIKNRVLHLIAMLDVVLEYPEDEMELDIEAFKLLSCRIMNDFDCLLERWKRVALVVNGANVVIAGRANAGKSSLFNALLNEERSIVSDIAGTTRDYIDSHILLNGLPCRLYDSAGLRGTKDKIEALGVERAKKIIESSHLVLYLIDGSVAITEEDMNEDIIALKSCKGKVIVVLTKEDIMKEKEDMSSVQNEENDPDDWQKQRLEKCEFFLKKAGIQAEKVLSISVKMNEGIEELVDLSYEALVDGEIRNEDDACIISEVQKILIEKAKNHLQLADAYVASAYDPDSDMDEKNFVHLDLVMEELQAILSCLGEITGEVRSDDVLSAIFSQFCVGK